jgi:hypothetical protein
MFGQQTWPAIERGRRCNNNASSSEMNLESIVCPVSSVPTPWWAKRHSRGVVDPRSPLGYYCHVAGRQQVTDSIVTRGRCRGSLGSALALPA